MINFKDLKLKRWDKSKSLLFFFIFLIDAIFDFTKRKYITFLKIRPIKPWFNSKMHKLSL